MLCQNFSIAVVSMNVCYIEVFFRMNYECYYRGSDFIFFWRPSTREGLENNENPLDNPAACPPTSWIFKSDFWAWAYGALVETSVQDYLKKYEFPDFPILRFKFLSNFQISFHAKLWRCGLIFENIGVRDLILPTSQSTIPPLFKYSKK